VGKEDGNGRRKMQYATYRALSDAPDQTARILEQNGLHWLKFGNEYFCYGNGLRKPIDWSKIETSGAGLHPTMPGAERSGTGSLYLVTQEGRTFQRTHPDAPVLLDKGRHLIVSLDQKQVDGIARHEARFSLRPVGRNEIVYETLQRPVDPPRMDQSIKRVVDALSRTSFAAALAKLASFPTRHSLSSHFRDAGRLCRDRLESMGYQVSLQSFDIPGGSTLNIVADKHGLGTTRSVTLVSAHLDSVNHSIDHSPDDPAAPAPGADDNGSGCSGLIEIARVLQDQPIVHDLRLVLFGGEEQDLLGSKHYVRQLPAVERARINAVVNMDMIAAVNTRRPGVLLEGGDPVSRRMVAGLSSAAHTYTRLTVDASFDPHDSDHCPFIDAGIPAALTIEGHDDANHNIHSANDTLDHVDPDLALEILRMNTAFIAGEIGMKDVLG
jgi:hypothetical protein